MGVRQRSLALPLPPPQGPPPRSASLAARPLTALCLCPPVHGIKWTCSNGNSSSGFSVEQLVQQILDSHQTKPQPRTHNCLCAGGLGEQGSCGQVGEQAEVPTGSRRGSPPPQGRRGVQ